MAREHARDLYFACFSDIHGWGGARTAAQGLIGASHHRDLRTLLLGTRTQHANSGPVPASAAQWAVHIRPPALLWRLQSWRVCGQLERRLRPMDPPKLAFVALHAYWAVAAKRVWPDMRVVYFFPCLLSNCLPYTWPRRRPPTLWKCLDFAGIRRAEHQAFALADLILTPTQAARDEVLAFHPAAQGRVTVCTYGSQPRHISAPLRLSKRRELDLAADAFVCLAAGRCDTNKAFEHAIRELPGTNPRGRLLIVGDGPEWENLRRLAADLRVASRVLFAGPQRDMAPWYAAADCVVSTSHYDTFPNVILEGMVHGKPVVVPRHDPPRVYAGAAEIVGAEGGGLLYDRAQRGTLAAAWNQLLGDPQQCAALGEQARTIAARRFRWEACVERILTACGAARPTAPRRRWAYGAAAETCCGAGHGR